MRRSNRLIVLVGLLLAVVAFVGVFFLLTQQTNNNQTSGPNAKGPVVVAATDIPLGATITDAMLTTQDMLPTDKLATAYTAKSQVIGQIARRAILTGQQITSDVFLASAQNIEVPEGMRGISVQVDQVTGVGTLIKPGDFVDMVVGFTADKFPVVTVTRTAGTTGPTGTPGTTTITPISGINATSVKLLLQGMQVLGTLLPTPTTTQQGGASPAPNQPTLNGQQEIAIVAVPAQYAEVIKFAQMDGNITLILRSSKDFLDASGQMKSPRPSPDITTGIILKTLVDKYGVLVPQVVQAILPSPTP